MEPQVKNQATASDLVRTTPYGDLQGKRWSEAAHVWLGVPFAQPPVGELRWRAPREPVPWNGVRQAKTFGSECKQYGGLMLKLESDTFGEPMGSEDCLYLNIWRPATTRTDLPVFVYVHGGLNGVGEAATSLYYGANLAVGADMIVVTINYRLGIFGSFAHRSLATGDPLDDSGNYGLLDILQALRWVKRCIGAFGGDPQNVTLAGESAGAFNIGALLVSPLAPGLFHRALCVSPLNSKTSVSMERARSGSEKQAARLLVKQGLVDNQARATETVKRNGGAWIAAHLKECDADDLLRATRPLSDIGLNSLGLTIDTLSAGRYRDGHVLPKDFKGAYERGELYPVPYMIGSASDEARIFELGLGVLSRLNEREVCELIQGFSPDRPFVGLNKILPRHLQWLYRLIGTRISSRIFRKTGVEVGANAMSQNAPVHVFEFAWDEEPEPFDLLLGASHMMPLPFLFGNFQTESDALFRACWSDSNRAGCQRLSRNMMAYVGNFARTGDANKGPSETTVHWPYWSADKGAGQWLMLDSELSVAGASS